MKILIVDDEDLALNRLKRLLNELGYENIIAFNDSLEALKHIQSNSYDMAFLDISMPQINGLELANLIIQNNPNIYVVFQSAYDEYAIKAYESAIDYIIKPTTKEAIEKSLQKVNNLKVNSDEKSLVEESKLIGKKGDTLYLVKIKDILYIRADLDEVIVRTKEFDCYVKRKIGDLSDLLQKKSFFRIHRSILVNVNKVKSLKSVEQSKLEVSFDGIDDIVTSSKDGAKEFREYMNQLVLK